MIDEEDPSQDIEVLKKRLRRILCVIGLRSDTEQQPPTTYERIWMYTCSFCVTLILLYRFLRALCYDPSSLSEYHIVVRILGGVAMSPMPLCSLLMYAQWLVGEDDQITVKTIDGHFTQGDILLTDSKEYRQRCAIWLNKLLRRHVIVWVSMLTLQTFIFNNVRIIAYAAGTERRQTDLDSWLDKLIFGDDRQGLVLAIVCLTEVVMVTVALVFVGRVAFLVDVFRSCIKLIQQRVAVEVSKSSTSRQHNGDDEDEIMMLSLDHLGRSEGRNDRSQSAYVAPRYQQVNKPYRHHQTIVEDDDVSNDTMAKALVAFRKNQVLLGMLSKRSSTLASVFFLYVVIVGIIISVLGLMTGGEFPDNVSLIGPCVVMIIFAVLCALSFKLARERDKLSATLVGDSKIDDVQSPVGDRVYLSWSAGSPLGLLEILRLHGESLTKVVLGVMVAVVYVLELIYVAFPPSCVDLSSSPSIYPSFDKCSKVERILAALDRGTLSYAIVGLVPIILGRIIFRTEILVRSERYAFVFYVFTSPAGVLLLLFAPQNVGIFGIVTYVLFCVSYVAGLYVDTNNSWRLARLFGIVVFVAGACWVVVVMGVMPLYLHDPNNQLRVAILLMFIYPLMTGVARWSMIFVGQQLVQDNRVYRPEALMMLPSIFFGLTSRLFLFTVSSIQVTVAITAVLTCMEIVRNLLLPIQTFAYHKILRNRSTQESMMWTNRFRARRSTTLLAIGEFWSEMNSIVLSFCLVLVLRPAYGYSLPKSIPLYVFSMLFQLFGEFVSDFVSIRFMHVYFDMKVFHYWKGVNKNWKSLAYCVFVTLVVLRLTFMRLAVAATQPTSV